MQIVAHASPLDERVVLIGVLHHQDRPVIVEIIPRYPVNGHRVFKQVAAHASVDVLFLFTPYPRLSRLADEKLAITQR